MLQPTPVLTFTLTQNTLRLAKLRAQGLQLPVCTTTALHVLWEL